MISLRGLQLLAVLPVLLGASIVGGVTHAGPSAAGCVEAAGMHHAALVIEHGNGAVKTFCVAFTESSLTGEQILQRSGVQYQTSDYYGSDYKAVCQIEDEPSTYPNSCWTASSPYWAMFVSRGGGGWSNSSLGISSQSFADGDAEGFRYEGQSDSSPPPSPVGVCPRATRTTAPPTRTPSSVSTSKPSSSAAPPSATADAAASPTATGLTASPSPSTVIGPLTGSSPPSGRPSGSLPVGPVAAGVLGAALVLLLVAQVLRARSR